jgi:tetratricopeptide (TPR) repeat protein
MQNHRDPWTRNWLMATLLLILAGCGGPPTPREFPGAEQITLYTVQPGETLHDLAERTYGDRSLGWPLAVVNELPDPSMVEPGTSVYIPNDPRILASMAAGRAAAKRPYNRGTYLMELGRDREAIGQLERALATAPETVTPRYHLGVALLRQGHIEDATRELEEVVRRRPLDKDFRYALGCAYLKQGAFKPALRQFDQALRFDPVNAPAQFGRALVLHRLDERDDAARAWQRFLELNPDGPWAEQARDYLMRLYEGD